MTDGEKLLLAIVNRRDLKTLSKVRRHWLDGSEVVQHRFIVDYYKDSGEFVGAKAYCEKFGLDVSEVDARPTYYLRIVRERYLFTRISEEIPKIVKGLKGDPNKKLSDLRVLVSSLSNDGMETKDVLYSDDTDKRRTDYEERVATKGVTYLSMGAEALDSTLYGYRNTDLITIGGRAGQGKTFLIVYLAILLNKVVMKLREEGTSSGDILFISNEIGEDELRERFDAIMFRLPYGRFLKGELTEREKSRYYHGLDALKESSSAIRIVYSCATIDELTALVGLYNPALIFVDGSYLLEPSIQEGWEKITYITRNLKRLAKETKTPIVNTTQMRRGSGTKASKDGLSGQDDFAYASSFVQDSDIALRMFQDADMKFFDQVGLELVKGRRAAAGTTYIFQNNLEKMDFSIKLSASYEDDTATVTTVRPEIGI